MKDDEIMEWALMLERELDSRPAAETMPNFFSWATDFLQELTIPATHISIGVGDRKAMWQKFGGVATKRMIQSGFDGINSVSLCHVPAPVDIASIDRIAKIRLSFRPIIGKLLFSATFQNNVIPFQGVHFDKLIRSQLEANIWDFGWALIDGPCDAEYHLMGATYKPITSDESTRLRRWSLCPQEKRMKLLRDIYPVNVLNVNHLELMVGGKTLGEFIREVPGTRVEVIAGHTVWTMPPEMVDGLREDLGAAGILIARG